jgi:hypothetical protein
MGLGGEHVEGQLARLLLHFVQRSRLLKVAYHRWQRNGIILVAKRVLFLSVRIAIARRRARAGERPGNHYSSALDSMESCLKRLSLTKYLETPPGVFVVLAARWHRPRWPRAVVRDRPRHNSIGSRHDDVASRAFSCVCSRVRSSDLWLNWALWVQSTQLLVFFENKTLESRGRSSHFLEKTRALNDGFGKKCFLVSASDVRVRRAVSMASKA